MFIQRNRCILLDLLCKNITEKIKQENYNVSKPDNSSGHTLLMMEGLIPVEEESS